MGCHFHHQASCLQTPISISFPLLGAAAQTLHDNLGGGFASLKHTLSKHWTNPKGFPWVSCNSLLMDPHKMPPGEVAWEAGAGSSPLSSLHAAQHPGGLPRWLSGKESSCQVGDTGSIPGSERSSGEGNGNSLQYSWASLVAQLLKNPPAIWETWVR